MGSFTKPCLTVFSFCSIVFTISSIISFTRFLSDFSPKGNSSLSITSTATAGADSNAAVPYTVEAIVVNISLLCIFIILHSSLIPLHEIMSSVLKMPVLKKMFYSLLSSCSLQLIIRWWMPIPQYTFWNVDIQEVGKLRFFVWVHIASWTLIYAMMITMDVADLLGFKQVYFHITGRPDGSSLSSEHLKNFYKKMRHPSFVGFALIFWVYPCMRLDRLLLASVWSLYMLLAWRPDTFIFNYLVQQNIAKRSAL